MNQREELVSEQKHKLKALEVKFKKKNDQFNSELEKLIRERLITSEIASSLMNDHATVKSISKNLIRATKLLYIESNYITAHVKLEESDSGVIDAGE
ncbi:MAG: hypothetical protein O2887_17790 [Bacteroidetes bacterium]|nr:hypothetical protein [Bacteroidota bacterium]